MLFNSFAYMIFLPVVVALFWLCPNRLRVPLLLVASYVFYMSWKPVYGVLIFALTLANWLAGLIIARDGSRRKLWLTLTVSANLLVLAVFKYAYFAHDVANQALLPFGKCLSPIPIQIILPLGISFFVFEFIHYVVDVYKGCQPVRSFWNFALFASFFPTQIAGPIKRFQSFMPQLAHFKPFDIEAFDEGVNLILFGLFKKVIFADNLAVVVQSAFEHNNLLSSLDLWLAAYAFAFQIYFDFSGYTDIARGSAMLIGFKVPPNFNLPYASSSISEFWRRWHISLSTWLRDYLFIPLGGSRVSRLFTYRNLLITMVLGGLWHGAAMHFVVWGAYQGVLLVLHKEFQRLSRPISIFERLRATSAFHIFSVILTFHAVCIGWVFFRAETFAQSLAIIQKLFFLAPAPQGLTCLSLSLPNTADPVVFMILPLVLVLLFCGQIVSAMIQDKDEEATSTHFLKKFPLPVRAVWVCAMICLIMVFSPDTSPRFIYFQF